MRIVFLLKQSLILFVCIFWGSAAAYAHQPHIVFGQRHPAQDPVVIQEPQLSKAYYGRLEAAPDHYRIISPVAFELYVNILVADRPQARTDTMVSVRGPGDTLIVLKGIRWAPFFEPFVRDRYLRGPHFLRVMEPGTYDIQVYNQDNRGDYCLVVGRVESFSPIALVQSVGIVMRLKEEFFGRPGYSALLSPFGLIAGSAVLVMAGLVVAVKIIFWKMFTRKKTHGS